MRINGLQVALDVQSDERLVALAAAGSEAAFTVLVARYRRQLLSYCRRFESGSISAEDILQQTLLNAWRALSAGREVSDVRPWLYRIAHNVAISGLRRVQPAPALAPVPAEAAVDSAEDELERRAAVRQALAGMAALPSPQREVMLDSTIGGLSHEELAHFHGLSVGAVRGLIYRARTALRAAAAVLTPGPLLSWLARRTPDGASSVLGGLAGGGTVALGGAWLKGGAVLIAAGTLAGVAVHDVENHGGTASAPPRVSARVHARSRTATTFADPVFASRVAVTGRTTSSATGSGAIAGGGEEAIGAGGQVLGAALSGTLPAQRSAEVAGSSGQDAGGSGGDLSGGWAPSSGGGSSFQLPGGSGHSSGSGSGNGDAVTVPGGRAGSGSSPVGDPSSGSSPPGGGSAVARWSSGSSGSQSPGDSTQGATPTGERGQATGGGDQMGVAARSGPRGGVEPSGTGNASTTSAAGGGSTPGSAS